jgi:hypothetical protein
LSGFDDVAFIVATVEGLGERARPDTINRCLGTFGVAVRNMRAPSTMLVRILKLPRSHA